MDYPYYVIPDIEALPSTEGEERQRLVRRIAALVGDQTALRRILDLDPEEFRSFYPDLLPPDLDTAETIDSFIDKYGDPAAARSAEVRSVEELVPLPPADYDLNAIESSPLITGDESGKEETDSTSALLDSFLSKPERNGEKAGTPQAGNEEKTPESITEEMPKRRNDAPQLSESLARAMIKNGNYAKALEIITDLSLKNPKKSIYFADQIRFLKKLILNQSKSSKA